MGKVSKILNDNDEKIKKIDYIIMGIMILIFSVISFYNLGDFKSPQTFYTFQGDDSITVTLNEENYVSKIRYYTGYNIGKIDVMISNDNKNFTYYNTITTNSVLSWEDTNINENLLSIKFVGGNIGVTLGDIALYDRNGNKISIDNNSINPLIDEQNLVPDNISYMNSMYFDEIYFARSAYEYVHGIDVYEWTHPPVAKIIMAFPILLFGFSPFVVRLMGNIAGILIIPVMYILGKKLFKNRKYAFLSGMIMMFDNFHMVESRIALSDSYQILFILLSVLFMVCYLKLEKNDSFKKKAIYLIMSGIFIGLSIGVKWNALYVGLGLFIVFFIHLFKEYNFSIIKYIKNKDNIEKILENIIYIVLIPYSLFYLLYLIIGYNYAKTVLYVYIFLILLIMCIQFFKFLRKDKYLLKLFFVCVVSFILIPLIIYVLSYILFPNVSYYDGTLSGIFDINKMMYDYHAKLDATHPFSSSWYQWPIMYKPVWFYSGTFDSLKLSIVDIGNPVVWWFGIVSFIYVLISAIKKNSISKFLLIFILSTFVPYIFIGRIMFMYHYYITLPFVMLGIVAFIKWISEKFNNQRFYWAYIATMIITFIIFYPVTVGMPISEEYVSSIRWLSSWIF